MTPTMIAERFIAFVTKYALTAGIEEVEVEDCGNGYAKTVETYSR